jgi:hypothetical protein
MSCLYWEPELNCILGQFNPVYIPTSCFHKTYYPHTYACLRGTRWSTWLKHYVTRRQVAGSIPDEVTEYFNWPNTSSRIMALRSTLHLREMSTMILPGSKGRPARKTDNLTAICEPIVYKMWQPRRLTTLWASTACYRDRFTFYACLPSGLISSASRLQFWIVGIATGYGLDDRGSEFESRWGQEFSLLHVVQTGSGVH